MSVAWLNTGDNAWQLTAATVVGLQSIPGLVVLYGGIVKKKWAINSAFMAFYAFAAVLIAWILWAYNMGFGTEWTSFVGMYQEQGFSSREVRAAVAQDLGHGDGRGRYVAQVYYGRCSEKA
jgi:ammonia channel protein AmtB